MIFCVSHALSRMMKRFMLCDGLVKSQRKPIAMWWQTVNLVWESHSLKASLICMVSKNTSLAELNHISQFVDVAQQQQLYIIRPMIRLWLMDKPCLQIKVTLYITIALTSLFHSQSMENSQKNRPRFTTLFSRHLEQFSQNWLLVKIGLNYTS